MIVIYIKVEFQIQSYLCAAPGKTIIFYVNIDMGTKNIDGVLSLRKFFLKVAYFNQVCLKCHRKLSLF